ncbi:MAG: membrane protein insertase YidC [Bacteroidota bacterium]
MDRNALTGLILITILMLVYFQFFAPKPPTPEPKPPTEQSEIAEATPEEEVEVPIQQRIQEDSLQRQTYEDLYGDFFPLLEGEEGSTPLTTDKLTLTINHRGGYIASAYLNEYKTFDSLALPIISEHPDNSFSFNFTYQNRRRVINSADIFFSPVGASLPQTISGADSATITFRAALSEDKYIDQIYTIYGDRYDLGYRISFHGFQDDWASSYYNLAWTSVLPKTELSVENMRRKSTIFYHQSEDYSSLSISDNKEEEKLRNGFINWVAFKSQFFSSILDAEQERGFKTVDLSMTTPEDEEINRKMVANFTVDASASSLISNQFRFYLGPNEYNTLRSYDNGYQELMDLGWWIVGYINIGTVYIFNYLEKFFSNYGIIIIILAFIFRMAVFPLTYKSHTSMAKMRVINQTPEMKELDAKHKDEPQKLQMAKMGVYKDMGVNMFGGCLPMLASYPFLIALFFFFPQSVELRQQSFLWANDLSTYDNILDLPFNIPGYGDHVSLFTLLMAISTFIYTWYQQKSQPATGANSQMKVIAYIMPVFLLVFLNNYASGLSLYYLCSNVITISQTTLIRAFMDDEKLLAQMRENKKARKGKGKGKNKNRPKSRLEKWAEAQQKKQQTLTKNQKKAQAKNRQQRRKK